MKRWIPLLLIFALCIPFSGCRREAEPILQPVNFYYRNQTLAFGTPDGLISPKIADADGYNGNLVGILNEYLKGPNDERFHVTFPASTKLLSISFQDGTAYLQMNDSIARLSGIDLTIACACITMTTMELTGATSVCISATNESLDGATSITMNQSNLLLFDNTSR